MNKKYLTGIFLMQTVLFAALIGAACYFFNTWGHLKSVEDKFGRSLAESAEAVNVTSYRYEKCSSHIQKFVENLNDAAPAVRHLGFFMNGISGKKQLGIPIVKCSENIRDFCTELSEYYSGEHQETQEALKESVAALEHSGNILREERIFSQSMICGVVICMALALVFAINSWCFFILIREFNTPENRQ